MVPRGPRDPQPPEEFIAELEERSTNWVRRQKLHRLDMPTVRDHDLVDRRMLSPVAKL
jgi:hypothetical protein